MVRSPSDVPVRSVSRCSPWIIEGYNDNLVIVNPPSRVFLGYLFGPIFFSCGVPGTGRVDNALY